MTRRFALIFTYLHVLSLSLQDVAYLDLCSHPTLPSAGCAGSQTDDDNDGDDVSICSISSSQVIYRLMQVIVNTISCRVLTHFSPYLHQRCVVGQR